MKKNVLWLLLAAMLFSGCSGKNTVNEPVELPDKTVASGDTSTSIVLDGTENSQYVKEMKYNNRFASFAEKSGKYSPALIP